MYVKLDIDLFGYFCNEWPMVEIYHNDQLIYENSIVDQQTLSFSLQCEEQSTLKIRHKNKFFGENNRWDTDQSTDRYVQIIDVRFDNVSIGQKIMSELQFCSEWSDMQLQHADQEFINQYTNFLCNGRLGFNGYVKIDFTIPVYNWLILNKFKLEKKELSYFSQYTENFHYEKDLELIKEIKELMNFD